MRRTTFPILPVLLLACLTGLATPRARADDPEPEAGRPSGILPLAEVRPGMRGVGYTVKSGTRLERFEVEVLDVMSHFITKQDVILVRCLGEDFKNHRIAQGMSGSPVYVDGRLMGALSYTWGWAIEPLGGITPIESMLAEGQRPLEGRPSGAEPPTPLRHERVVADESDGRELAPIGTPLCLGGFSAEGRRAAAEAFQPLGFDVHGAGGGLVAGAPAGWANLDAPMEPGAALVVELLRGDFSASALGTCTYVDGDKVYGFGHTFNDLGETLFPMSVGYVYTIVSSRNISFKLGSAIRQVGALVQDRPACIIGVLGKEAPMVPFDVKMSNGVTGRTESFHFEATPNTIFFQRLLLMALGEAFLKGETTLGSNTKTYHLEVKLKGVDEPWSYDDVMAGFDTGLSRILIGLVDRVMNHSRQRAEFEWVKIDVSVDHTDRRAFIDGVTASKDEVKRGEEVDLTILLGTKEGDRRSIEHLTIRIPDSAPDGNFVVSVAGGDDVPADVAAPVDVLDIPRLYGAFYKSTELIAVVPTNRVDLDMDGRLVRNVPLSAVPRLLRSFEGADPSLRPVTEKVRKQVEHVIAGTGQVVLRVVP